MHSLAIIPISPTIQQPSVSYTDIADVPLTLNYTTTNTNQPFYIEFFIIGNYTVHYDFAIIQLESKETIGVNLMTNAPLEI